MSDPNSDVSPSPGPTAPLALPQIRIVGGENDSLVMPFQLNANTRAATGAAPCFEPFRLVKVPKSMTDQLVLLAERVWLGHRRCIGFLLLLDVRDHTWSFAVPRQRAGHTASCWSGLRADALGAEDRHILGGSIQSRIFAPGEEPADAAPPVDGVHLVHQILPEPQRIWTFLRSEGRTLMVPADDVVFDDLDEAVRQYLPRLGLVPPASA